jgi:hypothetical protein
MRKQTAEAIAELKSILEATARKIRNVPSEHRVIFLERLGCYYRIGWTNRQAAESFRAIAQLDPDQGACSAAQVIETYRSPTCLPRPSRKPMPRTACIRRTACVAHRAR